MYHNRWTRRGSSQISGQRLHTTFQPSNPSRGMYLFKVAVSRGLGDPSLLARRRDLFNIATGVGLVSQQIDSTWIVANKWLAAAHDLPTFQPQSRYVCHIYVVQSYACGWAPRYVQPYRILSATSVQCPGIVDSIGLCPWLSGSSKASY